jgi:hypothetical protein
MLGGLNVEAGAWSAVADFLPGLLRQLPARRGGPVRAAGSCVPASLQLVGPLRGEELLLSTAQRIEAAVA